MLDLLQTLQIFWSSNLHMPLDLICVSEAVYRR